MTKVKFLMEKKEGDLPCNVFAFFPEEKFHHWDSGTFMSYAHVGQHSPCHIDYAKKCKKASPEQYEDLLNELKGQGYDDLLVMNKPKTKK